MAWKIEFDPAALKELKKLDKPVERRILKFLRERVARLDDPRQTGAGLQGP
jgi:mRNA interferase RelE/StbE